MLNFFKKFFYLTLLLLFIFLSFFIGYIKGVSQNTNLNLNINKLVFDKNIEKEQAPVLVNENTAPNKKVDWNGPDLWKEVNKRRVEFGVNPLSNSSELCTIAAIRLNFLLDLGKLDGHEGFSKMPEEREDLKWIFEKYNNVSEFLLSGAQSPLEAVSMWENTLGHKKILDGGEYVWGCIYAQDSFAVAIAAF